MKAFPRLLPLALALATFGCTTRTETRYLPAPSAPAARPHSYGTGSVTWVAPTPAAPEAPAPAGPADAGTRQPAMRQALQLLHEARARIAAATRDKGGHRMKAIRETDVAISEVQAGIAFDRTH